MDASIFVAILLVAPLIGFFINGFRWKSGNAQLAGVVASAAVFISFLCSVGLFVQLLGLPADGRAINVHFFKWIHVGDFKANASFLVDQISSLMILIIAGVGFLIHIFSIGYMSHDDRPAKYFAYLNFFIFNMLLLVLGDNLLVMFVGWEGVGLCSYLLIGFWFSDKAKAAAGMKAFITNRIGDAGFLIGIFILFQTFGSIEFSEIIARLPGYAEDSFLAPMTLACLFLFVGACGKSAQIPLYVWLPDAMAGPTPVSALIHAATMVTAGVYMMVRLSAVYVSAPLAMGVVAAVGALTALLAATIGMTQWDIKKILAYSTVSQLGYMVLGVGVGAFGPAMFHLMTHAFFKALMFLGSGSVIHAMHEEQDVRKMGGLKKLMPITHMTFVMGWIAIIGLPPFAGFFSKDEILWHTFSHNKLLWVIGFLGAGMTAFYMTRLMALTFWGKSRVPDGVKPHESPPSMTFPLVVLAILSVIGGWVGIPHVIGHALHIPNFFGDWLAPVIAVPEWGAPHGTALLEFSLMGMSIGLVGVAAWFAYDFYVVNPERPKKVARKLGKVYDLVANKYWVDEIYFGKIINPLVELSKGLWAYIDVSFIDKTTYVLSDLAKSSGSGIRTFQNGNMQSYALYISLGVLTVLMFVLVG